MSYSFPVFSFLQLPTGAEDAPPAPTTPSITEPTTAPDSTPQNVDDFGSGQPKPKPEAETPPESTPRSLEPEEKLSGTDTTATEDPSAPSSGTYMPHSVQRA